MDVRVAASAPSAVTATTMGKRGSNAWAWVCVEDVGLDMFDTSFLWLDIV
jgi:hypothetical protein